MISPKGKKLIQKSFFRNRKKTSTFDFLSGVTDDAKAAVNATLHPDCDTKNELFESVVQIISKKPTERTEDDLDKIVSWSEQTPCMSPILSYVFSFVVKRNCIDFAFPATTAPHFSYN